MVDTQKDFQTKRLLDMAENYIPQFLAEFKRLNDMVLDILMNNIDELNKMVEDIKEHNEDLEPSIKDKWDGHYPEADDCYCKGCTESGYRNASTVTEANIIDFQAKCNECGKRLPNLQSEGHYHRIVED